MVYDINNFDPSQNQNVSFGDFVDSIGNAAQSAVDGFAANIDANAINNLAIANLNKAQADAIRARIENQKQITKNVFTVVIVAIVAIVVVVMAKKLIK